MAELKPGDGKWWMSKTNIAIIVGAVLKIVGLIIGYEYSNLQIDTVTNIIAVVIPIGLSFITDILAIWARIVAKFRIA
jgi:putative flippase GtrA